MEALIGGLRERDLDILLAAALHSSSALRRMILKRVGFNAETHALVSVEVSVVDGLGETDVLLRVDHPERGLLAIMIEDKIDAIFQPRQAERARMRGELMTSSDRCRTVLCAPEAYSAEGWDCHISLQELVGWIDQQAEPALGFLRAACQQAVGKQAQSAVLPCDEAIAFWRQYRRLALELLPDSTTISRLPEIVGRFAPWPRFGHPASTLGILEHKPEQGRVDLTFSGATVDSLAQRFACELGQSMTLVKVGTSAAVRIEVPRLDHLESFEQQKSTVMQVLAAIRRLQALRERRGLAPT